MTCFLIEWKVNPDIKFEVFIHKVDGLSDDQKIGKSTWNIKSIEAAVVVNGVW